MIRLATIADAAEIARIVNAAFVVEQEFRPGDRTNAAEIAGLIARDAFLLAEDEGQIIGAVHVRASSAKGYFGMLAVAPAGQRKGLGGALTAAAEDYCRARGGTVMTMSTGEERRELVAWYERRGYRVTSVEVSNNPAFNRPLRIVQMEKPLT
ncbi:MAG TPA: GNAT family N-acetyltransferase [Myxococcales bacterium]|jgi:ribosomal protein S18 acetylase RimI-like enzyme